MLQDIPEKQVNYTCLAYAALTVMCFAVLNQFEWIPLQIRVSEALCIIALFSKNAPVKLLISCVIANFITMLVFRMYPEGLLNVMCGSITTLLGALWCYHYRNKALPKALFGFVLFNMLIIPAYLPSVIDDPNFYTIPIIHWNVYGDQILMYVFGVLSIGLSEALVIYGLGFPFANYIKKYVLEMQAQGKALKSNEQNV